MKFDWQQLKQMNRLDFEEVHIWPREVKITLACLLTIVVAILSYQFILQPKLPALSQAEAKEQQLRQAYQAKYRIAVNLPAYQLQLRQLETDLDLVLKSLPNSAETPGLLDDITFAGTSSGLMFRLLRWQPEQTKDFYTELPIEIEVIGKFHEIGIFSAKLADLSRIVTMHNFTLQYLPNGELSWQVQGQTYRSNQVKPSQEEQR